MYPSPLEIHWPIGSQYLTFHITPWPELVYHPSPRVLWICTKVRRPILPDNDRRTGLSEFQFHNMLLVRVTLHHVALAILAKGYRAPISGEILLIRREGDVRQVVRAPEVRLIWVVREDLGCELCCCPDSTDSMSVPSLVVCSLLPYSTLLYITCASPMTPSSLSI